MVSGEMAVLAATCQATMFTAELINAINKSTLLKESAKNMGLFTTP
jgi:hypothetical protein